MSNRRTVEDLKRMIPEHRLKILTTTTSETKKRKPKTKRPAAQRSARRVLEKPIGGVIAVPKPLPPSPLKSEDLAHFKKKLLLKRREIVGNMTTMEDEALRKSRTEASGDLSQMPIHMADIGTDNYEQEFSISLIQNERQLLKEIDEALHRIQDGTYGVCLATHEPISKPRLRAKPWARYCIEYKRAQEAGVRRGA